MTAVECYLLAALLLALIAAGYPLHLRARRAELRGES